MPGHFKPAIVLFCSVPFVELILPCKDFTESGSKMVGYVSGEDQSITRHPAFVFAILSAGSAMCSCSIRLLFRIDLNFTI